MPAPWKFPPDWVWKLPVDLRNRVISGDVRLPVPGYVPAEYLVPEPEKAKIPVSIETRASNTVRFQKKFCPDAD